MRLLKVIETKDSYTLQTVKALKFLGVKIFSRKVDFQKPKDKDIWSNCSTGKKASRKDSKKLDFWIDEHNRFVNQQK